MLDGIREDIRCVFDRDPAARSTWEVVTCYPGFHARLIHRLAHRLWGWNQKWLARFVSNIGRFSAGAGAGAGAAAGLSGADCVQAWPAQVRKTPATTIAGIRCMVSLPGWKV